EQIWLTTEIDYSVSDFAWSPDGKIIWFTVEEESEETFYELQLSRRKLSKRGHNTNVSDLTVSPDGRQIIFIRSSFCEPAEVYQAATAEEMLFEKISHLNDEWAAGIEWGEASPFHYKGWQDES